MNQEKLNKCIDYLKQKYHPVDAIILHGSRASGYARELSDWDFMVLTEHNVNQKQHRDNIAGEEIEFEVFQLPIENKDIFSKFNTKLKHAKAVYDENGNAQVLIDEAQKIYQAGITEEEVTGARLLSQRHYLLSALGGMKDSVDNPAMFMKKLGTFYPRIINIWYKFKERSYSDNIYLSIPYLQSKDPEFAETLKIVYSLDTTPIQKIEASEKLIKIVFEN